MTDYLDISHTGFSSQIGTKFRDWAVGQAGGSCYSWAALSSKDSKTRYWIAPKIFIAWTSKRDSCTDDNETSSLFGQSASTLLLYVNIILWLSVIPYSQRLPSDRNVKISLSPDRRRDAADAPDAVSVAAAVNERGLVLLLSSFRHTGCEASTSNKDLFFI